MKPCRLSITIKQNAHGLSTGSWHRKIDDLPLSTQALGERCLPSALSRTRSPIFNSVVNIVAPENVGQYNALAPTKKDRSKAVSLRRPKGLGLR